MNNNDRTLRSAADQKNMTIGAAVKVNRLRDDKLYRETVAKEFNSITAEYEMKFQFMQPEKGKFNFRDSDELMSFANQNNMDLRGHALVWHISNPEWLEKGNWSRKELLNILETHIKTVVGRYKGQIKVWDVVNEAVGDDGKLRNSFWLEKIGPEYIELAFKWAHEADPSAKLVYNDYRAEEVNQKSNRVYQLVSDLKAKGIPIHGVGFQMHMSEDDPRNFKSVSDNMKRLGNLGLEVEFTEADVRVRQPATAAKIANQSKIYQQIIETAAEADNSNSVTIWGVTDRYSWIPDFFQGYDDALPFDENYRPKEAFNGLLNGIQEAAVQKSIPGPNAPKNERPDSEGDIITAPPTTEVDNTPIDNVENDNSPEGDNNKTPINTPNPENDTVDPITPAAPNEDGTIRIEAELYNINDFKDSNAANRGGAGDDLRRSLAVDVAKNGTGDGMNVGWISQGEYLTYDINVAEAGKYRMSANIASPLQGNHGLKVSVEGQSTKTYFGNTGGWQQWQSADGNGELNLSAGNHTLRVDMLSGGFNLDYVELEQVSASPAAPPATPTEVQQPAPTPPLAPVEAPQPSPTQDPLAGDNSVGQTIARDLLTGSSGNDRLKGTDAAERFDAGTASSYDIVFGRGGDDMFVLNQGRGHLIIRDFQAGSDQLELTDGVTFGSIQQNQRNGKTFVSTNGDTLAELTSFTGKLTAADFVAAS